MKTTQHTNESNTAAKPAAGSFFAPTIQAKLTINAPGDAHEQEADAVADKVVQRLSQSAGEQSRGAEQPPAIQRLPAIVQRKCAECEQEDKFQKKEDEEQPLQEKIQRKPVFDSAAEPPDEGGANDGIQRKPSNTGALDTAFIQRKCAECEQEDKLQKKEDEEQPLQEKIQRKPVFDSAAEPPEEGAGGAGIQRKSDTNGPTAAPDGLSAQLQSSKGGGSSLPEDTRTQMEGAIGADFSNVRVHTGSSAAGMSQSIQAQAFTHGSDIYFNSGKYDTGSTEGKKLLAHELVHTVQQGGAVQPKIQRQEEPGEGDAMFQAYESLKKGVVINGQANLEHTADDSNAPITVLRPGDNVLIKWWSAQWYFVIDPSNKTKGYVRTASIQIKENTEDKSITEEDLAKWESMTLWTLSRERGIAWGDILKNFEIDASDKDANSAYAYAKKRIIEGWTPADGKPEVRSWFEGDLLVVDAWTFRLTRKHVLALGYLPDTGFTYKWHKSYKTADQNAREKNNVYELRDKPTLIELEYKQAHEDPDVPFMGSIYEFGNKFGTYTAYVSSLDSKYGTALTTKLALFQPVFGPRTGIIKYVPTKADSPIGVRFRSSPFTETDMKNNNFRNQHNTRRELPLNTKLTLLRYAARPENWYEVQLGTGEIGYVSGDYIETNLPESGAFYHLPAKNESLLRIASRYLKGGDARDFANQIVRLNDPERVFKIIKTPFNKEDSDAWSKVQTLENVLIWIPSTSFALQQTSSDPGAFTSDDRVEEMREEQKKIQEISNAVDATTVTDFKQLIDQAEKIDKSFVERFNHLTGLNWVDVLGASFSTMGGNAIAYLYNYAAGKKLIADMEVAGQDIMVLLKIRKIFRDIVLKKAFLMLDENAGYLQDELSKYQILENWQGLHAILSGKAEQYNEADRLRLRAIKRYLSKMSTPVAKTVFPTISALFDLITGTDDDTLFRVVKNFPPNTFTRLFLGIELYTAQIERRTTAIADPNYIDAIVEKFNNEYPEFKAAIDLDTQATRKVAEEGNAKDFKILYDQSVDWRTIARMDEAQMKTAILGARGIIQTRVNNIAITRTKLLEDPELIWELQPVVQAAMGDYGILADSNAGKLVWDPVVDKEFTNAIRDIGLAAIGIVLGIAAFFTAGWTLVILAGLELAVSGTAAYLGYQSYAFHSAASDTNIGELQALSNKEPSLAGVILAIIGIILSGAGAAVQTAKVVKSLKAIKDLENAVAEFDTVWYILHEAGLMQKYTRETFIADMIRKYQAQKLSDEIGTILDNFLIGLGKSKDLLKGLNRTVFSELYVADPATAKILLATFVDQPQIMAGLSKIILSNSNAVRHFTALRAIFAADDAIDLGANGTKVFTYMGSTGYDTIGNLPKLLYIAEKEGLNNDLARLTAILTDRAEQAVLLSRYSAVFNNWKALPNGTMVLLDEAGLPTRLRYPSNNQIIERPIDLSTGEMRLLRDDGSVIKAGDIDNPGDAVLKNTYDELPKYKQKEVSSPQITGKPGFSADELSAIADFRTRYPNISATDKEIAELLGKINNKIQFNSLLSKVDGDIRGLNKLVNAAQARNISLDSVDYLLTQLGKDGYSRLILRGDKEIEYAVEAFNFEKIAGGHSVIRHGPDVLDDPLKKRITEGISPDSKISPASPSTRFKTYQDWVETRQIALESIQNGHGVPPVQVDLTKPPGIGGNPSNTKFEITIEHSSRANLGEGYVGTGTKYSRTITDPNTGLPKNVQVWPNTAPISGLKRTKTTLQWTKDVGETVESWKVKQHIPWGKNFDNATQTYSDTPNLTL